MGLFECECHLAVFIDNSFFLTFDMFELSASLVFPNLKSSAFLFVILRIIVVIVDVFDLLGEVLHALL